MSHSPTSHLRVERSQSQGTPQAKTSFVLTHGLPVDAMACLSEYPPPPTPPRVGETRFAPVPSWPTSKNDSINPTHHVTELRILLRLGRLKTIQILKVVHLSFQRGASLGLLPSLLPGKV